MKLVAVAAIVLFAVVIPASAQADAEKRLDDLEGRVKALETVSQLVEPAPSTTRSAWRKVAKNMSPEQVRALIGEPDHIDNGLFETWYWKSGGLVVFVDGGLHRWSEPF